jgi:hypothetical protein
MKLTATALALLLGGTAVEANSLTDWNSLTPSQRITCCSSSSSQIWVRTRVWDSRTGRWTTRYVSGKSNYFGTSGRLNNSGDWEPSGGYNPPDND